MKILFHFLFNKASEKKSLQALRNHIEKIIISNDKAKRLLEFTKNSTFKFNYIDEEKKEVNIGSLFEDIY